MIKSTEKYIKRYSGFEQGPIRPPSEAHSLLIRVTRNCPWNRCTFCPLYKQSTYSIRPLDHIKQDIDQIFNNIIKITKGYAQPSVSYSADVNYHAYLAAKRWYSSGMKSIFLQDSNALGIEPEILINLLKHIKIRFPHVERITSYARSSTIKNISLEDLTTINKAGLNRIHIGLESGSNEILKKVCKGATKQIHIEAGKKVKSTGIELSEYVIPGLGGQQLSQIHAVESADALNQINPDFIRLRSLALPSIIRGNPPFSNPDFIKCTDIQIVKELYQFISLLDGISSTLLSDHILNLFADLQGSIPEDKEFMLNILARFLNLQPEQQQLYILGRRMGIFSSLDDLQNKQLAAYVKLIINRIKESNKSTEQIADELMQRFI